MNYSFDALGRRASRTAGNQTTSFVYDGADVVADKVSTNVTVDYLNGAGIDEKLRQGAVGNGLYFLTDHLGSTSALTNAGGGVMESLQSDAFGAGVGSALTRYDYTGRERDAATGLLYYRNHWLDPQQGRFVTEDSIGIEGGLNLYAYVGNSPLNYVDPLGNDPATLTAGSLIAYGTGGAAAATVATGAAVVVGLGVVWYGAYKFGEWTAEQPWNPLTHPAIPPYTPPARPVPNQGAPPFPRNLLPPPLPIPAQKGRESGRNWATEQAKATAQALKKNVCDVLDEMLAAARAAGQTSSVKDIEQAQKYLGCRKVITRGVSKIYVTL